MTFQCKDRFSIPLSLSPSLSFHFNSFPPDLDLEVLLSSVFTIWKPKGLPKSKKQTEDFAQKGRSKRTTVSLEQEKGFEDRERERRLVLAILSLLDFWFSFSSIEFWFSQSHISNSLYSRVLILSFSLFLSLYVFLWNRPSIVCVTLYVNLLFAKNQWILKPYKLVSLPRPFPYYKALSLANLFSTRTKQSTLSPHFPLSLSSLSFSLSLVIPFSCSSPSSRPFIVVLFLPPIFIQPSISMMTREEGG